MHHAPRFTEHGARPGLHPHRAAGRHRHHLHPASRDDPEGAKAWPSPSEKARHTYHIDCWYGINGSTARPDDWPFTRIPMDGTRTATGNRFSKAALLPRMPVIFDGWWIHNGK